MGFAQTVAVELVNLTCWCGTPFAAATSLYNSHREQRGPKSLFCPLGHNCSWGKTEMDRLRQQLEAKDRTIAWEQQSRANVEKQLTALKGQLTKVKNRISNGVCPECNRHFTNVERHMATKHAALTPGPVSA